MQTRAITETLALVGLVVLLAGGAASCGGAGGTATTTEPGRTYLGTQSPGDVWGWSLEPDGTFSAENRTLGFTYSGTYVALPSSFLKLTVTTTTEPGMTVPADAYAFEVPGSALVVAPAGSDSNVIVAVSATTCPAGPTLDLIWTELTQSTWDAATDTAYGTAAVTITGATWDVATSTYLLDGTPLGGEVITGLVCADGVITDPLDPDPVIAMAPSGVFIRDEGPGGGAAMGMRQPATPVLLADLTAAGREFRGFHYEDGSNGLADSVAVWARPDGLGGLYGGEYDDIEANVEVGPPHAVLAFDTQAVPGIVNGSLTDAAGTSDMVFLINQLGGRYFLFGISVDSHDGHPYNFVAIETGP